MFVSAVIVHDQMQVEPGRGFTVDPVEETDKFLMPVAWHTVTDHLAVEHAERRKQGGRAVALVVVGHGPQAALLQRQARLGALQSLDLALLVHTQDQGLLWRIQIQTHHIVELLDEVLVPAELEGLEQMGLEVVLLPDALDSRPTDSLGLGHAAYAPVRRLGRCGVQGGFNDGIDFSCRQSRNPTRPRGVLFQAWQSKGQKTLTPKLYRRTRDLKPASDLLTQHSVGGHLNHLGTLYQPQRKASAAYPGS